MRWMKMALISHPRSTFINITRWWKLAGRSSLRSSWRSISKSTNVGTRARRTCHLKVFLFNCSVYRRAAGVVKPLKVYFITSLHLSALIFYPLKIAFICISLTVYCNEWIGAQLWPREINWMCVLKGKNKRFSFNINLFESSAVGQLKTKII